MAPATSGVEPAERGVGFRGGFLDQDGGDDEVGGRAQAADREILDRARRLHAVVRVGGNLELAQRIALNPEFSHRSSVSDSKLDDASIFASSTLEDRRRDSIRASTVPSCCPCLSSTASCN